jgi:hypothetical protein
MVSRAKLFKQRWATHVTSIPLGAGRLGSSRGGDRLPRPPGRRLRLCPEATSQGSRTGDRGGVHQAIRNPASARAHTDGPLGQRVDLPIRTASCRLQGLPDPRAFHHAQHHPRRTASSSVSCAFSRKSASGSQLRGSHPRTKGGPYPDPLVQLTAPTHSPRLQRPSRVQRPTRTQGGLT